MDKKKQAVFLDRDGVIIEDSGLITSFEQIKIFSYTPHSLKVLKDRGYKLIIITNQAVVARGMIDPNGVEEIHSHLNEEIFKLSGCEIDDFYFCPHHPNANVNQYKVECECRKPLPGMLIKAAKKHNIDLKASFMVGDRLSDIIAGHRAGCRTILVETGKHKDKPIISTHFDHSIKSDFTCSNLLEASFIICKDNK